jgi:ABC-type bacteriocin/lantibiotic exporter with double-glycine peptidase domain
MFIKNIQKVFEIINTREKVLLLLCFLLMLGNTFLELLSIGILIPLISLILNANIYSNESSFAIFQFIRSYFDVFTLNQILIFILFIFLLKNLFIVFYNFYTGNVALRIRVRLVQDLYKKYLFQDFQFFLKRNSWEIIRNINEAQNFSLIIMSYLTLLLEISIFVTFSIFLLLSNPELIIIIFLILVISIFTLSLSFKNRLFQFGSSRQKYEKNIKKLIIDNFSNIRSIKIRSAENSFSKLFSKLDYLLGSIQFKTDVILQIPRAAIEVIIMFLICGILIFSSRANISNIEIITFLSILLASILRLMPSATRIIAAIQRLKFFEPLVNLIVTENKLKITKNLISKKKLNNFETLEFHNVSFKYPNNHFIFRNINLKINRNKIYCFIGKNGVGKSTLIHLIAGILNPSNGEILYNGQDIKTVTPDIGYVSQNFNLIDDTIKNNITFPSFQKKIDLNRFKKAIYFSNLGEFVESLPNGINTLVGERGSKVSGGESQRIGLARSLYYNPEILILDEFNNNLDQNSQEHIILKLNKLKKSKTIILVSHSTKIFKICDEIYKIKNEKIKRIK